MARFTFNKDSAKKKKVKAPEQQWREETSVPTLDRSTPELSPREQQKSELERSVLQPVQNRTEQKQINRENRTPYDSGVLLLTGHPDYDASSSVKFPEGMTPPAWVHIDPKDERVKSNYQSVVSALKDRTRYTEHTDHGIEGYEHLPAFIPVSAQQTRIVTREAALTGELAPEGLFKSVLRKISPKPTPEKKTGCLECGHPAEAHPNIHEVDSTVGPHPYIGSEKSSDRNDSCWLHDTEKDSSGNWAAPCSCGKLKEDHGPDDHEYQKSNRIEVVNTGNPKWFQRWQTRLEGKPDTTKTEQCSCKSGKINNNARENSEPCDECTPGHKNYRPVTSESGKTTLEHVSTGAGPGLVESVRNEQGEEIAPRKCKTCMSTHGDPNHHGEVYQEGTKFAPGRYAKCPECKGEGFEAPLSNGLHSCENCSQGSSDGSMSSTGSISSTPDNIHKPCNGTGAITKVVKHRAKKILQRITGFGNPITSIRCPHDEQDVHYKDTANPECPVCKGDDDYTKSNGKPCSCKAGHSGHVEEGKSKPNRAYVPDMPGNAVPMAFIKHFASSPESVQTHLSTENLPSNDMEQNATGPSITPRSRIQSEDRSEKNFGTRSREKIPTGFLTPGVDWNDSELKKETSITSGSQYGKTGRYLKSLRGYLSKNNGTLPMAVPSTENPYTMSTSQKVGSYFRRIFNALKLASGYEDEMEESSSSSTPSVRLSPTVKNYGEGQEEVSIPGPTVLKKGEPGYQDRLRSLDEQSRHLRATRPDIAASQDARQGWRQGVAKYMSGLRETYSGITKSLKKSSPCSNCLGVDKSQPEGSRNIVVKPKLNCPSCGGTGYEPRAGETVRRSTMLSDNADLDYHMNYCEPGRMLSSGRRSVGCMADCPYRSRLDKIRNKILSVPGAKLRKSDTHYQKPYRISGSFDPIPVGLARHTEHDPTDGKACTPGHVVHMPGHLGQNPAEFASSGERTLGMVLHTYENGTHDILQAYIPSEGRRNFPKNVNPDKVKAASNWQYNIVRGVHKDDVVHVDNAVLPHLLDFGSHQVTAPARTFPGRRRQAPPTNEELDKNITGEERSIAPNPFGGDALRDLATRHPDPEIRNGVTGILSAAQEDNDRSGFTRAVETSPETGLVGDTGHMSPKFKRFTPSAPSAKSTPEAPKTTMSGSEAVEHVSKSIGRDLSLEEKMDVADRLVNKGHKVEDIVDSFKPRTTSSRKFNSRV